MVYRLTDPQQYRSQNVLIVGGGDSALEAAVSIAAQPQTKVTLSYRSGSFTRAKRKNREKVETATKKGDLRVLMKSNIIKFTDDHAFISCEGKTVEIANDSAIICAGGVLPTAFLKSMGIEVETKHGTA